VAFLMPPIGLVHLPSRRRRMVPKYFVPRRSAALEIFKPYHHGLLGLSQGQDLWVITYRTTPERGPQAPWPPEGRWDGMFASAGLDRPNPIEFLRARIEEVDADAGLVLVTGLDSADGVPILDLRPTALLHPRVAPLPPPEGHP
jgi:tRNA (Thr-GGU) A37 N-methylase